MAADRQADLDRVAREEAAVRRAEQDRQAAESLRRQAQGRLERLR